MKDNGTELYHVNIRFIAIVQSYPKTIVNKGFLGMSQQQYHHRYKKKNENKKKEKTAFPCESLHMVLVCVCCYKRNK